MFPNAGTRSTPVADPLGHHEADVAPADGLANFVAQVEAQLGELGPIGGHIFIHGFTTSIVLLSKR